MGKKAASEWSPPGLLNYLRDLQREYGDRGRRPSCPSQPEHADPDRFNGDHVLAILVGWAGPWIDPNHPRITLPLRINALRRIAKFVQPKEVEAASWRKQNRALNSLVNRVRGANLAPDVREEIIRSIEVHRRPFYRFRPMQKDGITVHPSKAASRQSLWTPTVLQLASYLRRTTKEPDGQVFKLISRILFLTSEGLYPDDPALVKQRWYRATGNTK